MAPKGVAVAVFMSTRTGSEGGSSSKELEHSRRPEMADRQQAEGRREEAGKVDVHRSGRRGKMLDRAAAGEGLRDGMEVEDDELEAALEHGGAAAR